MRTAPPVASKTTSAKLCDFGPLALKSVRQRMIEMDWCRTNINKAIGRLKRMVRWAAENELIPPETYHRLQAVAGLRYGRSGARESEPVKPVSDSAVETTLPHMPPTLRAMAELQRITGMRPGEVCNMRGRDLETSGQIWIYRPEFHKTRHHGRERLIFLGPKAQEILRPFLRTDLQAALFSPAQADAERRAARHEARKTPMSYGNVPGSNRCRNPKRKPSQKYDTTAYGRAIAYACNQAFPPPADLENEELRKWRSAWAYPPRRFRS